MLQPSVSLHKVDGRMDGEIDVSLNELNKML